MAQMEKQIAIDLGRLSSLLIGKETEVVQCVTLAVTQLETMSWEVRRSWCILHSSGVAYWKFILGTEKRLCPRILRGCPRARTGVPSHTHVRGVRATKLNLILLFSFFVKSAYRWCPRSAERWTCGFPACPCVRGGNELSYVFRSFSISRAFQSRDWFADIRFWNCSHSHALAQAQAIDSIFTSTPRRCAKGAKPSVL